MISFAKALLIFASTIKYLIWSYRKDANITELKQMWALAILKKFNFEIIVKNRTTFSEQMIFVGNHVSFLDIIVLMAIHPKVVFLSKKEVSRWPVIGTGAKRMGTLFVDRDSSTSRGEAKNQIKQMFLNKTNQIHLAGFPSGTTCLTESKPWKKGLFEVAQLANVQMQTFRITYEPLRACAYIDDDNLILTLTKLFNTKNKKVIFEWGEAIQVTNPILQVPQIQNWATPQGNQHEEKAFSRPSHSFQLQ